MKADVLKTDVLIIGGAIAGIRAAVEAHDRGADVILTTKGLFGKDSGATWMVAVGYQCWGITPGDTLDVQVEDTLRCGWFLNQQENVYAFLAHVPDTARELMRWGARYRMKEGKLWPLWQLGCSVPQGRSLCPAQYPHGELAYNLSRVLPRQVRTRKKIRVMEDLFVTDLLTRGDPVVGALGIDIRTGEFKVFEAKTTLLATGGYHGIYQATTGNHNLTGDGQAMALRAGVDMMDFEFNQTLPSALWPPAIAGTLIPFFLIMDYEARMYNSAGERFIAKWDPVMMERSTRAIISRSIFHEIKEGKASPHGGVYVSVTHQPASYLREKLKEYERTLFSGLKESGVDLTKDAIETGYAIHYCQGGCSVNTRCETDKPGLYAAGEVASGSKDGSDRMMSNALPYCMAMGIVAGREAAEKAKKVEMPMADMAQVEKLQRKALAPLEREDGVRVYQAKAPMQDLMTRETEYGRTEEGLKTVLREIERYKKEVLPRLVTANKSRRFNFEWINCLEFDNMMLVGECIARNALMRTESRGLHDRWDYPKPSPEWFKNIHLRLVNGELKQWTTPVEFTYWQPEPGSLGVPQRRGVRLKEYQGWRAEPLY